jgi:hypothetical protein
MPLAHIVGYMAVLKSLYEDLEQLRVYMEAVQTSLEEGRDLLDKAEILSKTLDLRMSSGSRDYEELLNFLEHLRKSADSKESFPKMDLV